MNSEYNQGFKDACDVLIESLEICEEMGYSLVKIQDIKKVIKDHLKSKVQKGASDDYPIIEEYHKLKDK